MKASTWTWAALLLLSALSFSISETAHGRMATALILGTAGLKSGLVGWQFMELRTAHIVWRLALFALLASFLGVAYLLFLFG